ncbi:hypothetical protein [Streptomyces jumonjinensis]|uniref:Recombinase RecT n=1 Tax=Streptomyces jumonjinensis TaxID=1945 RepID=A0A646KLN3_STRJU|nr:hypothetical protein [Streptomyces jumonjinensis]MQT03125.1 hypothetical protein [Streptomyces jumonjinensis]
MTSEIATRDENAVVTADTPAAQPTDLMQWVESARQASIVAQSLAKTSFAGAYRGKPDEITAAILTGQELGLQPMTALKSIDVIQGQPALRAHAMRGILQARGHEVEVVESTDTLCIMRGRRNGSESWQQVVWDIPRARLLGLLGKDQWKKQPKTMLVARATGEICRLVASDALHGMPYVAEELDGSSVYTGQVIAPKAPLNVAAITAVPEQPAPTAPEEQYTVGRDDHPDDDGDGLWQQEETDDQPAVAWPAVAEPGSGAV